MEKGYSRDTRLLTKYLDQDTKDQIDLLLMEASISTNQTPDFTEDIEEFYKEITHVDIEDIRRKLNDTHCGLDDVKERIVEYIAINKRNKSRFTSSCVSANYCIFFIISITRNSYF